MNDTSNTDILLMILGMGFVLTYFSFCIKLGLSLITNKTFQRIDVIHHNDEVKKDGE